MRRASRAPASSSGCRPVTINFDGSEGGMKGCLTALAKLIGGYWYFENKTLYLFVTPPGPAPDPIDDTPGRFLHDPAITWTIDKSQVRTRVYGKGASTQLAATVDRDGDDLSRSTKRRCSTRPAGRRSRRVTPDGAASRVLTYTGVQLGGGGGLVGPGAAPSSAPGLALARRARGSRSGAHGYAVTFVDGGGRIACRGPIASITVGRRRRRRRRRRCRARRTAGGAIDPGTHYYARDVRHGERAKRRIAGRECAGDDDGRRRRALRAGRRRRTARRCSSQGIDADASITRRAVR